MKQIQVLANPVDAAYVLIPLLATKPLLYAIENAIFHNGNKELYKSSLFGYIEKPLILLTQFPLWLFALDVASIIIHALGWDFHIKGGLPDLLAKVSYCLLGGTFLTRIKVHTLHAGIYFHSSLVIGLVHATSTAKEDASGASRRGARGDD